MRGDPLTCDLQNSDSPTSDNLTPQETTTQETGTVGAGGGSLSCPGSSVVAEDGLDNSELNPLIESSAEDHLATIQDTELSSVSEDEA